MDNPGFKTILCPVDFSELSAHALRHVNRLAECGDAKVIAIYANRFEAPPYFTAGRVDELQRQFRDALGEAERSLKAFVDLTLGESGGKVETRVVEALPADGILEVAANTGADLIVMGTHGRTGFNRWMLGSVTERILRESPVPLLTVRAAPRGPVRRILSPIDGTEHPATPFASPLVWAPASTPKLRPFTSMKVDPRLRRRICATGFRPKFGTAAASVSWSGMETRQRRSWPSRRKKRSTFW